MEKKKKKLLLDVRKRSFCELDHKAMPRSLGRYQARDGTIFLPGGGNVWHAELAAYKVSLR